MTLVITNGTLIDGRGRDPLVGSLVIQGERIVVDGDVLEDVSKIANPTNVKLVLKGGQAAKNTLV